MLEFRMTTGRGRGSRFETVHIPVPPGREAEAQRVISVLALLDSR